MKYALLDTGFASLPIYEQLLNEKKETYVIGNRTEDPLAQIAGENWINLDYADIGSVSKEIRKRKIEYLIPGCTDISYETYLCLRGERQNLDETQNYPHLIQKDKFRELCKKLDIKAPRTIIYDQLPQKGLFICKPTDSYSGKGITVFRGTNIKEAERSIKTAIFHSRSNKVIIEEFIDGQLYSISAFIKKFKVYQQSIVKEFCVKDQYAVDLSFCCQETPNDLSEKLRFGIEKISRELGLSNGLLHLQFILKNNIPFFIEASRRCPGDLYSRLVMLSENKNYIKNYINGFLGKECVKQQFSERRKHILRRTFKQDTEKIFTGIKFSRNPYILEIYPLKGIRSDNVMDTRTAILFSEFKTKQLLLEAAEYFLSDKEWSLM